MGERLNRWPSQNGRIQGGEGASVRYIEFRENRIGHRRWVLVSVEAPLGWGPLEAA